MMLKIYNLFVLECKFVVKKLRINVENGVFLCNVSYMLMEELIM